MSPRRPYISIGLEPLSHSPSASRSSTSNDIPKTIRKPWYYYLPLCATVLLILAPHPSLLYVLIYFHLRTLHQPSLFVVHLTATYTLTFMILSSLMLCVVRNPGTTPAKEQETDDGEVGVTEALMSDTTLGRWCRKCWAPKPERAHHCSTCGQCVLKMDHHCPWLASCIGHRTYPAFLHFLCLITLFAFYLAMMSISALSYAFQNPYNIDDSTPIHELILAFTGLIVTFVVGSFLCYHIYLISTNQTTLEHISPFLLLKHLPPLPRSGHNLSDPPLEQELSGPQRRLVKDAHHTIRMYDLGWRRNWAQVLGCDQNCYWLIRVWCGGSSPGDGKHFNRNPRAEDMLADLAEDLVKADDPYIP